MYHGCIKPESAAVSVCAALYRTVHASPQLDRHIPAQSGTIRQRPIRTDIPVFPFWEQEAGSSNLPTPTSADGVAD